MTTTPPPVLQPPATDRPARANVLLFATGSVATIKLPLLVGALLRHPVRVCVVLSAAAERFLAPADVRALAAAAGVVAVHRDQDEWAGPPAWARGDPVLHIELRKWADLMLIAPLSANSLAAMAAGLCPSLGLSVVRAWDTTGHRSGGDGGDDGADQQEKPQHQQQRQPRPPKRILVAPAMNTLMYLHPLTEQQLGVLRGWGWVRVLEPVDKLLACGDVGVGGMMEVADIVREVVAELGLAGSRPAD